MDLQLTHAQIDLQHRLREWLAREAPRAMPVALAERAAIQRQWQRKLYDAGWLGLGWPVEYGGQGGTLFDRLILNLELATSEAPPPFGMIGLDVVGPTLLRAGTEEQKRRLIPRLLSGVDNWCQGFSEPNAGSDLASLRTSAIRDGDVYIVTGTKVWTSHAQYAERCALLVRTDPSVPPHAGISYLLVDMSTPGITVRPLTEINGDAEFSQLTFDDARVPVADLLGEPGDGWKLALQTVANERGLFGLRRQVEFRVALDELAAELRRAGCDEHTTGRLGECEVLVDVLEAHTFAIIQRLVDDDPRPMSSVDKLFLTQVEQAVFRLGYDSLGDARRTPAEDAGGRNARRWIHDYLHSRSASIYGGTSEIQRNIVAQRLLGLPRA